MNVNELWSYRDAVKQLKKAQERLLEYETVIYSPGGVRASGIPIERCNNSPDRMAVIAETHEELLTVRNEAKLRATAAYNLLRKFEKDLDEEEQEVFFLRYIKGLAQQTVGIELHKTERAVRYINKRIRDKFSRI